MLVLGVAGVLGTALALVAPVALGPALAAPAAAYGVVLAVDDPPLDARAAGVAAALLVVGELVGWARELGTTTRNEPGGTLRRPVWIAGLALGALALAWTLLAVVDHARVDGLAIEVVGAVAALALLVLVLRSAPADAKD